MKRVMTLFAAGIIPIACGQVTPFGTIDGKPIPANVFQRQGCDALRLTVQNAARDQAALELNVKVTPEDLAKARAANKADPVAQSNYIVGMTKLIIAALTAVDQGQDPHQVYTSMLEPKSVPERVWEAYQKQWKNPQGRAVIERGLTLTPFVLAQGIANFDFTLVARNEKLDRAVDRELAASDPQFRTYLEHWNKSAREFGGGVQHSGPLAEHQYMNERRSEFWKARVSQLNVSLSDPTLGQRCGLAAIGVADR